MIAWFGHEAIPIYDESDLKDVLNRRDRKNGLELWIADSPNSFPCIAVHISPPWCDLHFFPYDGHAGFRCLSDDTVDEGETHFLWQGCDPGDGEFVPNRFVLRLEDVLGVIWNSMIDRAPSATVA